MRDLWPFGFPSNETIIVGLPSASCNPSSGLQVARREPLERRRVDLRGCVVVVVAYWA